MRLSCSVRLPPGLRKLGQPPCPSAGTNSLYAVICLPAVKTSCKVSHYLRRLTREAGPDRGAHRCPESRRGPQTSPPGGPHACPGLPGCGAAQRPAPERCRRARGGPAPRPMAGSPAPREGSLSTNCRFLSSASGGEPRCAKSTSEKTSRATPRTLGGDAAPEADCEAGRSSAVWSFRPERGLAGNQGLFGPGLGPRLASRPRQGQSGQHRDSTNHPPGTSGSGTARGPRLHNGRNGTTEEDWR